MNCDLRSKNHDRVARMIGHALTLSDSAEVWDGASFVMRAGLNGFERACVFAAAGRALPHEDRRYVVRELEAREGAGMPLPPFLDVMDDATWWASHASIGERKAVLVAAFQSLSSREQTAFLVFAGRRDAA